MSVHFPFVLFCACLSMNCELAAAQEQEVARPDLQWFQDAKLGIFIHWGSTACGE